MWGDRNRDKKHQSNMKGEEPEACMKYNKRENDKRIWDGPGEKLFFKMV